MPSLLRSIHPKVGWPTLVKAILTIVGTLIADWQKGGQAALLTGFVGGTLTIVGLVTGYAVSSPPVTIINATSSSGVVTTPTAGGGSVTQVP